MTALFTLDEAKKYLGLQDAHAERDEVLQATIEAVTSVVEARVGWVVLRDLVVTVDNRQGGREFVLPGSRVREVKSAVDSTGTVIDVSGFLADHGVLSRGDGGRLPAGRWTVTLEVGFDIVPPAIILGAKEILREAWQSQQGPAGSSDKPFLVSYRAAAFFQGYEVYEGFA